MVASRPHFFLVSRALHARLDDAHSVQHCATKASFSIIMPSSFAMIERPSTLLTFLKCIFERLINCVNVTRHVQPSHSNPQNLHVNEGQHNRDWSQALQVDAACNPS